MSLPVAQGILAEACAASGMSPEQIRCKTRFIKFVRVRQAVMYALRRRTEWSSTQIARFVGIKDHTTVLHGIKKIPEIMADEEPVRLLVGRLMMARPSLFYEHNAPPERVRPRERLTIRVRAIPVRKSKPPAEKFEVYGRGRDSVALNEDGECRYSAGMIRNLRDGSTRLAAAILDYREGCSA